jgi:hypothetical protein
MATLLIATPFVHSKALLTHAMVSDVRGLQPQKRLRVSCRQASVTASGDDGSSSQSDRPCLLPVLRSSCWSQRSCVRESVADRRGLWCSRRRRLGACGRRIAPRKPSTTSGTIPPSPAGLPPPSSGVSNALSDHLFVHTFFWILILFQ